MRQKFGFQTVPNGKSYILFCAGEDSGDAVGESLVKTVVAGARFRALGAGGTRMQGAGMHPIVDFENLPVSGFGDVLPKYFKLRKSFKVLRAALESPDCLGLVAIDYPGFNMKLAKLAGALRKPCLYVAPPQVWAWKSARAHELAENPFVKLAVFFDFEETAYRSAGCDVVRVKHPYLSTKSPEAEESSSILLLPGSRKSQALRNLPLFLKAVEVSQMSKAIQHLDYVLLAARQELVPAFERALLQFGNESLSQKIRVAVAPPNVNDRNALYCRAKFAVTAPGTATLELALSGCSMAVCTKPDFLTYCLGSLFVKTKYFALPNIILDRSVYPEMIVVPGHERHAVAGLVKEIADSFASRRKPNADILRSRLSVGESLESLMAEFLRKFV